MTKEKDRKKERKYKLNYKRIRIFICTLLSTIIVGTLLVYLAYTNELKINDKNAILVSGRELQIDETKVESDTKKNENESNKIEVKEVENNNPETPLTEKNKMENPENKAETAKGEENQAVAASNSNIYAIDVENVYATDGKKVAYLTFDDGPTENITPHVLDVLAKYNIKATFFVIGKMADAYPDILKRLVNEGHAIGNHTYSHNYKHIYESNETFIGEVKKAEEAFGNILGKDYKTRLFRFPGGSFESYKKNMVPDLNKNGYRYIDWNTVNGDEEIKNPTAEWLINRVKETSAGKNKVVVLMHDSGNKHETLKALPSIIEYLQAQGYEFKTIK